MNAKLYDHLTHDEANLRVDVFIVEQKFEVEFDELDEPGRSTHVVFSTDDELCAAVCRIYSEGDPDELHVGRIVVKKSLRGGGRGAEVMAAAEKVCRDMGAKRIALSAQCRARGFYEKCGYTVEGDEYLDEYCPHIRMTKTLD